MRKNWMNPVYLNWNMNVMDILMTNPWIYISESLIYSWFVSLMCMLPSAGENLQLLQCHYLMFQSNRTSSIWGISDYTLCFDILRKLHLECSKSQENTMGWNTHCYCSNSETSVSVIILDSTIDPSIVWWAEWGRVRLSVLHCECSVVEYVFDDVAWFLP